MCVNQLSLGYTVECDLLLNKKHLIRPIQQNLLGNTEYHLKQCACDLKPETTLLAPTWWQPHIPLLIFQSGSEVGKVGFRAAAGNPWQQSSLPMMRCMHAWAWVHVEGNILYWALQMRLDATWYSHAENRGSENSQSWVRTRVFRPSVKTPSVCIYDMVMWM